MSHAEMAFGLPPATAEILPDFTDPDSCREWLAGLPLTNLLVSQSRLARQLNLLNRYPLPTDQRLKILELLRDPINFVQDQGLKRFAGRPLPFNTLEQAAFDASQALWQELVTGYLQCLHVTRDGTTGTAPSPHLTGSLAATRALQTMLGIYLDTCHASILTASTYWRQLHLMFRAAEELKVTQLPVEDNLRHKKTAASAYIEVLLVAAAFPHELRPRQLGLVVNWAHHWSSKVTILQRPPADTRTPSLRVDLTSDQPAAYQDLPAESEALRWLDLSELRKSIKKRLVLLAQGGSPLTLHLGKGCAQPACEALLKRTYRCWCKGGLREDAGKLRFAPQVKSSCQLVSGFEAIHYCLTGQSGYEQNRSIYFGHHEHDEIATFGRITTHVGDGTSELPRYTLEEWRVVDQNTSDLYLQRPLKQSGNSLAREQLVAVRLHDSEGFILCKLCWIAMSGSQDALIARLQLLPGTPEGICIRGSVAGASHGQSSRGLFLPDIDRLGEAASMLTPLGWFMAERIIEVELPSKDTHQVRLVHLVDRGADFDRVNFEWL